MMTASFSKYVSGDPIQLANMMIGEEVGFIYQII